MDFYTGCHHPGWLWDPGIDFPVFVSHRSLSRVRKLRPSTTSWALDSGAFTEISAHGEWQTTPEEYVDAVARYDREVGRLEWAAQQDTMCEPWLLARTGHTVEQNQHLTVENFIQLRELWPSVSDRPCPIVPTLQGWARHSYARCAELFEQAGVRLAEQRVVGLGSVCRRQSTLSISVLVNWFAADMRLHAFGAKTGGLALYGDQLASADSMAWSLDARRAGRQPGCSHATCANCPAYARSWRSDLLNKLGGSLEAA